MEPLNGVSLNIKLMSVTFDTFHLLMSPVNWLKENMVPYYPLGVYRDVVADGYANAAEAASARSAACPIAHPEKSEGGN